MAGAATVTASATTPPTITAVRNGSVTAPSEDGANAKIVPNPMFVRSPPTAQVA